MKKHLTMMLAMALTLPSVAMAAETGSDISVTASKNFSRAVDASDLDLTRAAGQSALRSRLSYAVRQVCGTNGATGPLLPSDEACMDEASANAEQHAQALIAEATRQASVAATHGAN